MAVAGVPELAIMHSSLIVALEADASPVVTCLADALIATLAHVNSFGFAALFGHGSRLNRHGVRRDPWLLRGDWLRPIGLSRFARQGPGSKHGTHGCVVRILWTIQHVSDQLR